MMMGDFGYLLSCLTRTVRHDISTCLGFNISCDIKLELLYKYFYALKGLRNALAHDSSVFDVRFNSFAPSLAMKTCLELDMNLQQVNFDTIDDYLLLITYYLKNLHFPTIKIENFVCSFEEIVNNYQTKVSPAIANIVIPTNWLLKMAALKNFLKKP